MPINTQLINAGMLTSIIVLLFTVAYSLYGLYLAREQAKVLHVQKDMLKATQKIVDGIDKLNVWFEKERK